MAFRKRTFRASGAKRRGRSYGRRRSTGRRIAKRGLSRSPGKVGYRL